MNDKRMKVLAALCMASFLAACGGGGDDNQPPPPPPPPAPAPTPPAPPPPAPAPVPIASVQGLLSNTSASGIVEYTLVVPGGDIFHASNPAFVRNSNGSVNGFDILGRLSRNVNGQLQGTLLRFSTPTSAATADLQGTVNAQGTISVSITPTSTQEGPVPAPYSFVASPVTNTAMFNFNRAASLAEVGGNYAAPNPDYTLSVNATTGAITGRAIVSQAPGCLFTGSMTPQSTNYFRMSFTYSTSAADGCGSNTLAGVTYTGVAFSTLTRTNARELHMLLFNLGGNQSFAFTSTRLAQ